MKTKRFLWTALLFLLMLTLTFVGGDWNTAQAHGTVPSTPPASRPTHRPTKTARPSPTPIASKTLRPTKTPQPTFTNHPTKTSWWQWPTRSVTKTPKWDLPRPTTKPWWRW
jgi:hypothetical protein